MTSLPLPPLPHAIHPVTESSIQPRQNQSAIYSPHPSSFRRKTQNHDSTQLVISDRKRILGRPPSWGDTTPAPAAELRTADCRTTDERDVGDRDEGGWAGSLFHIRLVGKNVWVRQMSRFCTRNVRPYNGRTLRRNGINAIPAQRRKEEEEEDRLHASTGKETSYKDFGSPLAFAFCLLACGYSSKPSPPLSPLLVPEKEDAKLHQSHVS